MCKDATQQDGEGRELKRATIAHVAPFLTWIAFILMENEMYLFRPSAWTYALRSIVTLAVLLWFRPWRWYPRPDLKNLPLAFGAGVLVLVIWILPETSWAGRWPGLQNIYLRLGTLWPWALMEPATETPYAPEVCGWPLALARLLGSAVVIAIAEEFFWRAWLYRWLLGRNFLRVDMSRVHWKMILVASLLFGVEHVRWLVGFLAGLIYLGLMLRTRDIWACCFAHIVTNFLLGLYVLAYGAYSFW